MRHRFRGLLQTDTIVPLVLVAAAIIISLDPTVFGVSISERQIILAFFAFLGVDALLERTGRLYRIERRLDEVAGIAAGPIPAGRVLRARSSFERMDTLVAHADHSVLIIGINLEGAVAALSSLLELVRQGGTVRLLAMDPDGAALGPTAASAGVDATIRRQKIIQNLDLLKGQMARHLTAAQRKRVTLQIADVVLPIGVVGIDVEGRSGSLVVQHYLVATPADQAPLFELRRDLDQPWFDRYLAQCDACLKEARPW